MDESAEKRDSCGTQHYAQSPHTNTILIINLLHLHGTFDPKAPWKLYTKKLSERSRILWQELPVTGIILQVRIKALGHLHQDKPCPRGKNHRLIGILRGAHRSSALTLRKLKFLQLSYLEECSIEISYEYFSYTMTDISFHSSIWFKNTKTLN